MPVIFGTLRQNPDALRNGLAAVAHRESRRRRPDCGTTHQETHHVHIDKLPASGEALAMSSNASSKNPVPVPVAKKAELYRLTNPPKVARPTVALLLYIVAGVVTVDIVAVQGLIPLVAGLLLIIVTLWPVFHVAHDALHRAASSIVSL
jgi:hypothetical protein